MAEDEGAPGKPRAREEFRGLLWWSLRLRGASDGVMETAGALLGVAPGTVGFYLHGDRPAPRRVRLLLALVGWDRAATPPDKPIASLERLARIACAERGIDAGALLPLLDEARAGHPPDPAVWGSPLPEPVRGLRKALAALARRQQAPLPKPPKPKPPKRMTEAQARREVEGGSLHVTHDTAGGAWFAWTLERAGKPDLSGKASSYGQARERAIRAVLREDRGHKPPRHTTPKAEHRPAAH